MIAKIKKMRYKLLAFLIIVLLIFGYFSANSVFAGKEIDFNSFKGVSEAAGIYFSWLGSFLSSTEAITSHAVKNNTEENVIK